MGCSNHYEQSAEIINTCILYAFTFHGFEFLSLNWTTLIELAVYIQKSVVLSTVLLLSRSVHVYIHRKWAKFAKIYNRSKIQ